MTHLCVSKQDIIGSDNGLPPVRRQAIIWANVGILLTGPQGTNFSDISSEILNFFIKENAIEHVVCKMAAILYQPREAYLFSKCVCGIGSHHLGRYPALSLSLLLIIFYSYSLRRVIATYSLNEHGPLTRYAILRVAHAREMPRTFSPPWLVSDPGMHHDTCVTYVSWFMPGSLASGFLWSRWRGKPTILRIW